MKKEIVATLIVLIFFCISCQRHIGMNSSKSFNQPIDSANAINGDTTAEETDPPVYGVIGTVINDIQDSTLLKLMYGSYFTADGGYLSKLARSQGDTVAMKVHDRVEGDSVLIVYITGLSGGMKNHSMYCVTELILNKIKGAWQLTDAVNNIGYEDALMDYSSTKALGKYWGRLLVVGESQSGLADQLNYSWGPRHKINEPTCELIFLLREAGGDACVGEYHNNNCNDCHDLQATVDYVYDPAFRCLIFHYFVTRTAYSCDYQHPHVLSTAYQDWYMNADSCFLGRGSIFNPDEAWDRITVDSVHLTDSQIRIALGQIRH